MTVESNIEWCAAKDWWVCHIFFRLLAVVISIEFLRSDFLTNFDILIDPDLIFVFLLDFNCLVSNLISNFKSFGSIYRFIKTASSSLNSASTVGFRLHKACLSLIKSEIAVKLLRCFWCTIVTFLESDYFRVFWTHMRWTQFSWLLSIWALKVWLLAIRVFTAIFLGVITWW